MIKKYNIDSISKLKFFISSGDIIFLKGDLGAGKTTISKHIINNILSVKKSVVSPTYTYYNQYKGTLNGKEIDIFHFDLYRLENYDEFFAIGAEDIFDNNEGIIIVEWPDIIEKYYKSNLTLNLFKTKNNFQRELDIQYNE